MSPATLSSMDPDVWYRMHDPVQGLPWQTQRSAAGFFIVESGALINSATAEQMLAALWMGLMGSWGTSGRWVFRHGALHWQACWTPEAELSLNDAWPSIVAQVQSAQAFVDGLLRDDAAISTAAVDPAPTAAEQVTLMRGVMDLLRSDPQLAPLCDWDEEGASIQIEPLNEEEDWLVLMRPSPVRGEVCIDLPQAMLPEATEARTVSLQHLLALNDAQILGPRYQYVMDIQGRQASLQSRCVLAQLDRTSLRLELARALAVDEELSATPADRANPAWATSSLLPEWMAGIRG